MVYAGTKSNSGDPPTPHEPLGEQSVDDHHRNDATQMSSESVESLRRAVEIQETHVRMLRARKVARERLLLHIQNLLATGDTLEAHASVEHVVRQAEESFQQLLQTENAGAATTDLVVTEGKKHGISSFEEVSAVHSSVDPVARIFNSHVEAQLASVADDLLPTCTTDGIASFNRGISFNVNDTKRRGKKGRTKEKRHAADSALHVDPANAPASAALGDAPPPSSPQNASTRALLAEFSSRRETGDAAMLAALDCLQLTLKKASKGSTTAAGGSKHTETPVWLREDLMSNEVEGTEHTAPQQPQSPPSVSQSHLPTIDTAAVDYSDDFEVLSESDDVVKDPENAGVRTSEEGRGEEKS